MKMFNKTGDEIDPSRVKLDLENFDLIYGTMTVGKTTFIRALFNPAPSRRAYRFIDTDDVWEVLYLTHAIWDLKRLSPAVDNAMSGPVRMLTRELALRIGRPVITNMYMPFGRAVKVYREGDLTYDMMLEREAKKGDLGRKDLKITRDQVVKWSRTWCGPDPYFDYSIQLDKGEYLSQLFDVDFGSPCSPALPLNETIKLIKEAFPEGHKFLAPKPMPLDVAFPQYHM